MWPFFHVGADDGLVDREPDRYDDEALSVLGRIQAGGTRAERTSALTQAAPDWNGGARRGLVVEYAICPVGVVPHLASHPLGRMVDDNYPVRSTITILAG